MLPKLTFFTYLYFCLGTILWGQGNQIHLEIDYAAENALYAEQTIGLLEEVLSDFSDNEVLTAVDVTALAPNRDLGEVIIDPVVQFFETKNKTAIALDFATELDDKTGLIIIIKTTINSSKTMLANQEEELEVAMDAAPAIEKKYCAGASKQAQKFTTAPNQNVVVEGKEGTKVFINRSDLSFVDGRSVTAPIEVELKEFYQPNDIVLADLHTMEGDEVLETGGMLNLKITSEGENLKLKEGKTARILMPTNSAKATDGMNLYIGKEQADGAVDWERERRKEPTIDKTVFDPSSFIQVREKEVLDSITYQKINQHLKSNNYPLAKTKVTRHTHKEPYFDLELPYIPTPPPALNRPARINWGGIWINVDRRFSISVNIELPSIEAADPPPPPSVDILTEVKNIPIEGITIDGYKVGYSPKVALMLKDRSVFLRGEVQASNIDPTTQQLKFERVPLNQKVILVAFLDVEGTQYYAAQEFESITTVEKQTLQLEVVNKEAFYGLMANLAQ